MPRKCKEERENSCLKANLSALNTKKSLFSSIQMLRFEEALERDAYLPSTLQEVPTKDKNTAVW